ncbi:MAG: acyl-CoA dehydrogenase family protein [Gammaproteobacteria bacterium]
MDTNNEMSEQDLDAIRDGAVKALGSLPTRSRLRALLTERGAFDRELWNLVAELGWLGMTLPEQDGGLGLPLAARCVLAEEIGRQVASIPYTAATCALSAIARSGSAAQKQALLGPGLDGSRIATVACFEPGEAGVPAPFATTFDGSRLRGEKVGVCAGAFAASAIVLAADASGAPVMTIADLSNPAVTRTVHDTVDNSRGLADLRFEGAPAERLGGADAIHALLEELCIVTAFEQIGGAQDCLHTTRDYALQRRVFGQPIGAFQAVKHGLADLYVLIEIARGAAWSSLRAEPADRAVAAAAARVAGTRAYDTSAQEAIQLHGGIGTTWESDQHLHYRRARCLALEWGGPQYWRNRILDGTIDVAERAA